MHHTCFHSTFHPVSGQGQPVSEWSGQRGPRFKLEHSHGSRVLKKRRHADLKEDGTLGNFEKRRDCGSKRGHKQGSLPQFLKEQADQRAGQTLEESDAERDGHIMKAMQNEKDSELLETYVDLPDQGSEAERTRKEQKRLAKSFRKRLQIKKERHQELMKPESEKLKKKYDDEIEKLNKIEKKAWSQQMSIDFQVLNDKYLLNPAKIKWIAQKSVDRETIRNFVPRESVLSADAVVDMLRHPDTLSRHIRLVAKVGCWDALSKKWCVGCLWGATGLTLAAFPCNVKVFPCIVKLNLKHSRVLLNILSLATSLGHTVWCVDTTDVFHNGFSSDTFQEALCSKKNHLLFAAVVFGGYVVVGDFQMGLASNAV